MATKIRVPRIAQAPRLSPVRDSCLFPQIDPSLETIAALSDDPAVGLLNMAIRPLSFQAELIKRRPVALNHAKGGNLVFRAAFNFERAKSAHSSALAR